MIVDAVQARAPMTFNITAVATAAVQPEQAHRRQCAMREPVLAPIARPHQCHNCLPDSHALQPRMAVHEVRTGKACWWARVGWMSAQMSRQCADPTLARIATSPKREVPLLPRPELLNAIQYCMPGVTSLCARECCMIAAHQNVTGFSATR